MADIMRRIEDERRDIRRRALARQLLYALRETVQMYGKTPETPVYDMRVEFTDKSLQVVAPFVDAIEILQDIIWASDGCVGHRDCAHSMEPWQRARDLLTGKWKAEANHQEWPSVGGDNER